MKRLINEYVVKIDTPEGPGSGFLVSPGLDASCIYVITARHCLVSKENVPFQPKQLQIGLLMKGQWLTYQVKETDGIFYGENNQYEDIGIIILQKAALSNEFDFKLLPQVCLPPRGVLPKVTGFPMVTNNELKRTLYQLTFLDDQDYSRQLQIEVKDPVSLEYNADNLVEGYSGSPIVVESQGRNFVCGVFLAYEEKTKRILAIDLSLLNDLLSKGNYDQVVISMIETNEDILSAIRQMDANSQRVLGRIRQQIGTLNLERNTLVTNLKELVHCSKLLIVTGRPGCGKSAVVKKVLGELVANCKIIAVQGEQLDRHSLSEVFSGSTFGFKVSFHQVLSSPAFQGRKIVLIDSVEKILETEHAETILDFFELLKIRDDIQLILTCRSYAIEQLKIRFLQQFPAFPNFEVPLLIDEEIESVTISYPEISKLLNNNSINRLLRIPFNLDKAVLLPSSSLTKEIASEQEFAKIMWEYVIENRDKEINATKRRLRGEIFMQIALKRAIMMVPYAGIDQMNDEIIGNLVADQIVDKEPTLGRMFAASHDIYEDWALTRFIQEKYLKVIISQGRYNQFYVELGAAPAIRRAFRLWCSEKIQQIDEKISDLVKNTITDTRIPRYWKDELLVAIMQSPYSKVFLNENRDLLFANNGEMLTRVVFILQVACQEPDFSFIDQLQPEKRISLYHNINLVPFGEGWANTIDFLAESGDQIRLHFPSVIKIIMDWKKGIKPIGPLPAESRNVGLLLLRYFEEFEQGYNEHFNRLFDASFTEESILLLFRISELIKEELGQLIETAFRQEAPEGNYRLKNLRNKVMKLALSGHESMNVCMHYPDLIMEIAEEKWLYFPPSQEEIEHRTRQSPFYMLRASSLDMEHKFGLKSHTGMKYFPCSPYQTPVLNLLYLWPIKTLPFLLKFFNHVGDSFTSSDFGVGIQFLPIPEERIQVGIKFTDGTENKQHASMALWAMYRGTYLATPNLLESVLMALEKYLLDVGEILNTSKNEKTVKFFQEIWDMYFDTLLRQSNNVMTSAVLLSVSMAYRALAADKILPLLGVKEIYRWDTVRLWKEQSASSILGNGKNAISRQKALYEFQHLPHRKRDIRNLILNLSLGKQAPQILAILDDFYNIDPQDEEWQIMVGAMDKRKLKVTAEVENGIIVEPRLEAPLQKKMEETKKVLEENNYVSSSALWCLKKLKQEPVEEDNFHTWRKHFTTIREALHVGNVKRIHSQPGLVAGIGIRDWFDLMNEIERSWCLTQVIEIIHYEIFESHKHDFMHIEHTSFEMDAAYSVLPKVMQVSSGNEKAELKRYIFVSLIRLEEKSCRDALILSIHSFLWKADPPFAMELVKSMIRYSGISQLLSVGQNRSFVGQTEQDKSTNNLSRLWDWLRGKWGKKLVKSKNKRRELSLYEKVDEAEQIFEQIIQSIGSSSLELDFNNLNFDKRHSHYLLEVLRLIPWDTTESTLRKYYLDLLQFILDHLDDDDRWDSNERFHYELLQLFQKQFACFILNQPDIIALSAFRALTDWVYDKSNEEKIRDKKYDFVAECLDELINQVIIDESKGKNFWQLWEYLIAKDINEKKMPFADKLLLNYIMFSSDQRDWKPLSGQRDRYKGYITAGADLASSAKLISGIGFKEMMPDGVLWLSDRLNTDSIDDEKMAFYFEKIIIQCYYDSSLRKSVKLNTLLRNAFVRILDILIEQRGSSSAYIIRDDFISIGRNV